MKALDISELIKGLLIVIGIAMAFGKFADLKKWAIKEALKPPTKTLEVVRE